MAKGMMAGLTPEQRKQVRELVSKSRKANVEVADKAYVAQHAKLVALRKEVVSLIDKAKEAGNIPKRTNISKLADPNVEPSNVGSYMRRNFGRVATKKPAKKPAGQPATEIKGYGATKAKKTAPAKKASAKKAAAKKAPVKK